MWKILLAVSAIAVMSAGWAIWSGRTGTGIKCGAQNLAGTWIINHEHNGVNSYHDMVICRNALTGEWSGGGGHPPGVAYTYEWQITNMRVEGDNFWITAALTRGAIGTTLWMQGQVMPDGRLSGQWQDNLNGGRRQGRLESVRRSAGRACNSLPSPPPLVY